MDLFINTDKTQKEICEIVGWSERTFTSYKNKENWEEIRSATLLSPNVIIRNLYKKLADETADGKSIDPDKIAKLASSIEKLSDRRNTISAIINVFKEFTAFLMPLNSNLAKEVNTYQKQFIDHKLNES